MRDRRPIPQNPLIHMTHRAGARSGISWGCILLCGALCLGTAACPAAPPSESDDIAAAETLSVAPPLKVWPAAASTHGLTLYVDRSGSMRGFLDPKFPRTPTDYRSVIDGLVVGLSPTAAFGYGNELRATQPSLGVLGNPAFYSDNNTEMEQALRVIAADTELASSHVIVGDGRRGNPNTANEQFVQMRTVAGDWIRRGGTFMVAVSMAPFQPVAADPSGCRAAADPAACPLYAFAYVAPGDETRMGATLAQRFEHLFAWPVPALPPSGLRAVAPQPLATPLLEPGWAHGDDGAPVVRVRGTTDPSNTPLQVLLQISDTASPAGKAAAHVLTGQALRFDLSARTLDGAGSWSAAGQQGSLAWADSANPFTLSFITRGLRQGSDYSPRYLYRIELYPTGVPAWLEEFDADGASDPVRTYGLGRLFAPFAQLAQRSPAPAARIYAVVN